LFLCLIWFATNARAQNPVDGFDPGANANIYSMVVQPDGKILVGGVFTMFGGGGNGNTVRNHLARVNPDGTLDQTFDPGTNGQVFGVALQPDGKILVGGVFTMIGGGGTGNTQRLGIARLFSDGSVDPTFNPGIGGSPAGVTSFAVQPDGKIIVGGIFTGLGGGTGVTPRLCLGRVNPDGTVDASFNPGVTGGTDSELTDGIYKVLLQADGKILVGGDFTGLGGGTGSTPRSHIGRLNPDGSLDVSFDPGANAPIVFGLAQQPDGKILVGGLFSMLGGGGNGSNARNALGRLNLDGSIDNTFNPGVNNGGYLTNIWLQSNGKLVVVGGFSGLGGGTGTTPRSNIGRLNADGTVDAGFNTGTDFEMYAVVVHPNGHVYFGGNFLNIITPIGTFPRHYIASFTPEGGVTGLVNNGASASITAIAVQADGGVLVGGQFTGLGGPLGTGNTRNHLGRFTGAGLIDAFNPGANGNVLAMAVQPDGKIVVGGDFTMIGGGGTGSTSRNHIARLNNDGTVDMAFDPGADQTINALVVQPDGKILVGGAFTTLGGGGTGSTSRHFIGRLNIDGSPDLGFDPGANGVVNAIALHGDSILIAGDFAMVGGGGTGSTSRVRIARVSSTGVVDGGFNPGANGLVYALTVQPDGKILVGGDFLGVGGGTGTTARSRIARLNLDGSVDGSFDPGADGTVRTFGLQTNGRIVVGGALTTLGGGGTGSTTVNHLARLNGNGLIDTWVPGANATVNAVAILADATVVAGGDYTGIGGITGTTARNFFSRLTNPDTAFESMTVTGNHSILWSRSGGGPELTRVTFSHSPDGVTVTDLGAATRVAGGWQMTGLSLPSGAQLFVRGRGFYGSGANDGSGSSATIVVSIVPPPSVMTRNPQVLYFGATKNGAGGAIASVTPPQDVTIGFTGAAPTWSVTADSPWVQITNGGGTGAKKFTVSIVNPGNVIAGSTDLHATLFVTSATAATVAIPVHLAVQQTVISSAPPYGQMDAPLQNQTGVQGAIGVSGWVLDDVGVTGVKIYRNCLAPDEPAQNCQTGLVPGSPSTAVAFIGDAAFVAGVRPDLEAAFPTTPQSYRAGWGYLMLTNMLPHTSGTFAQYGGDGPLTFYAIATDVEGHTILLGRDWTDLYPGPTSITMANDTIAKPFGAIDLPTQGGTVSSIYGNFGWVLTPDLNTIADGTDILMPTNGSTLFVFVDGVPIANVTYNQCRGDVGNPPPGGVYCNDDVASIFGNATIQPPLTPRSSNPTKYRNLDAGRGPQGSYALDTTLLTDGLHSIAWSATDSNGRVEGIGSRNFVVLNGGSRPLSAKEQAAALEDLEMAPVRSRGSARSIETLPISKQPVSVRTGFDLKTVMTEAERAKDGVRSVAIPAMGRVELSLAGRVSGGQLVANGELRDLPVGSHLDVKTGVFTWVPPVGYLGTYRLVFFANGARVLVDVTVR
jgi:uncharacterized delta-60 repeat protein